MFIKDQSINQSVIHVFFSTPQTCWYNLWNLKVQVCSKLHSVSTEIATRLIGIKQFLKLFRRWKTVAVLPLPGGSGLLDKGYWKTNRTTTLIIIYCNLYFWWELEKTRLFRKSFLGFQIFTFSIRRPDTQLWPRNSRRIFHIIACYIIYSHVQTIA